MSNVPAELKYSKEHECAAQSGTYTVGSQSTPRGELLGDMVSSICRTLAQPLKRVTTVLLPSR